mgnify:CR=1 FL=1
MRNDEDVLGATSFGKAALKKLGRVPEGFRIYSAGIVGKCLEQAEGMRVTGRVFKLSRDGATLTPVAGTVRSVVVTSAEIQACR